MLRGKTQQKNIEQITQNIIWNTEDTISKI